MAVGVRRILDLFRRGPAAVVDAGPVCAERTPPPARQVQANGVRALYAKGRTQYRQSELAAAVETFRGLVAIEPENGGAWYYIGRAHYESGDIDGAIEALQHAVAFSPDNPNAVTWLARAHKRRPLRDVSQPGALSAAPEPEFETIAPPVNAPSGPESLFDLAHDQEVAGDLEASLETWTRIAKDQSRNPEPFVSAGRVLCKLGRPEHALRQFWSAIELDDPNRFAHREYAACLRAFGEQNPAAAKKVLSRGRDLAAHVALTKRLEQEGYEAFAADLHLGLFAIGRRVEHLRFGVELLRASGQPAQAIEVIARNIDSMPPAEWAYQLYADLCMQSGDGAQALPLLAQGIAQFPNEKALLSRHARILVAAKRWEEAAQVWMQVAELGPDPTDARNRVADCYRRGRNYERAVEEYRKVLATAPENEVALRGLGRCLRRMGSRDEAITTLETLVRLAPDNISNWDDLIYALARAERLPEALAVLARASERLGSSVEAMRKLALVAERALLSEEAERILQHALNLHPEALELHAEQVRYFLRQGLVGDASRLLHTTPLLNQARKSLLKELSQISAAQRYLGHDKSNFDTNIPEDLIKRVASRRRQNLSTTFVPGRVAIMTTQLSAGGAERQAVTTALGLSGRADCVESVSLNCLSLDAATGNAFYLPLLAGSTVQITSPNDADVEALIGHPELAAHHDLLTLLPEDLRHAVSVWLIQLNRMKPEVVHAWQDFACMAGAIAAMLAGTPRIVLATRNTRPDNRYRRWKRYMQAAYLTFEQTEGIVLCNNSISGAADYDDWLGFAAGTTQVVYNGVDFNALEAGIAEGSRATIRRRLKIPEGAPVVGGVFRLTGEKQPLVWLDAAAIVARQFPEAHFILCGSGTMRNDVEIRVGELGLADRVHLVGVQSPIAPWFRAMDVFLLASRKEGLPNVLLESQFLGTPVVASDVGGVREVMISGESGWAITDATAETLAERLIWSLSNKDWFERARIAGRKHVEDNFSIPSMLDRILQFYAIGAETLPVPDESRAAGQAS